MAMINLTPVLSATCSVQVLLGGAEHDGSRLTLNISENKDCHEVDLTPSEARALAAILLNAASEWDASRKS